MKLSAILGPLLDAKADHELIRSMIAAHEEAQADALEKRRESDRLRQAAKAERDRISRDSRERGDAVSSHARVEDSSSKKDNNKEEKKESAAKPRSGLDDFKAELSPILDSERIDAIVAVRRKKGAVLSAHTGKLLSQALLACQDVNAAADEMAVRNWTSIKPDWLEKRSTGPPRGKTNAFDAYQQIANERGWNEPEILPSDNGDAQRFPAEQRRLAGPVVDV